jgi:hypothetical protein
MRGTYRIGWVALGVLASSIEPAFGDDCKRAAAGEGAAIQKYANDCFERLGVDPAEFAKTFNCVDPGAAHPLKVEVGGVETKTCFESRDGPCRYAKDKQELEDTFKTCDFPAWLDDRCYGDSYVQVVKTSNSDVKGALLCRHKTRFTGTFDDFDDVAMIVHNRKSGETCWFQSNNADNDPDIKLNGQQVPGPVCDGSESFWMTPDAAKGIECIHCHDSGPWMNSRWMRRATQELGEAYAEASAPYLNSTPPFNQWPVPLFVGYDQNLAKGDPGCTDCHKIAAARPGFMTCDTWIKRATGRPDSNLEQLLTDEGKKEHVQFWMPDSEDGSTWTKATWEAKYKKHVDGLIACCQAVGKGPTGLPPGCKAYCPDQQDGKCPADRWAP